MYENAQSVLEGKGIMAAIDQGFLGHEHAPTGMKLDQDSRTEHQHHDATTFGIDDLSGRHYGN